MNLIITRLSDGKQWNEAKESLLNFWNEHYADDEDNQNPDDVGLFRSGGEWALISWYDQEPLVPIDLPVTLYSVTDSDSLSREQVRKVLSGLEGLQSIDYSNQEPGDTYVCRWKDVERLLGKLCQ